MRKLFLYIVLAVFSSAAPASGYVGIGGGQSSADLDIAFATSKDETGNAFKVYAGVDLHEHLGAEIGFADFGEFGATQAFTDGTFNYFGDVDILARSAYLAARARAKIGDSVEAFAKVGVHRWSLQVDSSYNVYNRSTGAFVRRTDINDDDSGTAPYFGVGLAVKLVESLHLRIEWERFQEIGNDTLGESDVDALTAGVTLRF